MKYSTGDQYRLDDPFKAVARLHQSQYRSRVLQVDYSEYGSNLTDSDARNLMNYYDGLNVRTEKTGRYPGYSARRDANMLRSEHIPFNMLAPLKADSGLAVRIIERLLGLSLVPPLSLEIEWAPRPKEDFLGDHTSFDTYIEGKDSGGRTVGLGIEVKYTEQAYQIRKTELQRVQDVNSKYWTVTRNSGRFRDSRCTALPEDDVRQLWRNHLLGLAMCQRGRVEDFVSIVLYPSGNTHMASAIEKYRRLLADEYSGEFFGCTFEAFIDAIDGGDEILDWKRYLRDRYLVA